MTTDLHPVHSLAHWDTSAKDLEKMKRIYDELVGEDPKRSAMLDTLIDWSRSEHAATIAYDNADFSGG